MVINIHDPPRAWDVQAAKRIECSPVHGLWNNTDKLAVQFRNPDNVLTESLYDTE